jgi:replication fork clamp-binding protein CrfC
LQWLCCLQVKCSQGAEHADEEFAEFLHLPGRRFTDDEEIRNEIQAETDRLTGRDRGISDRPIRLKISSPHVLYVTSP